jgi:hypothetical protein
MDKAPIWFLPTVMAGWNIFFFIFTLVAEGRVKPNVARYAVLYTLSIYPAVVKKDIQPFLIAAQS